MEHILLQVIKGYGPEGLVGMGIIVMWIYIKQITRRLDRMEKEFVASDESHVTEKFCALKHANLESAVERLDTKINQLDRKLDIKTSELMKAILGR